MAFAEKFMVGYNHILRIAVKQFTMNHQPPLEELSSIVCRKVRPWTCAIYPLLYLSSREKFRLSKNRINTFPQRRTPIQVWWVQVLLYSRQLPRQAQAYQRPRTPSEVWRVSVQVWWRRYLQQNISPANSSQAFGPFKGCITWHCATRRSPLLHCSEF